MGCWLLAKSEEQPSPMCNKPKANSQKPKANSLLFNSFALVNLWLSAEKGVILRFICIKVKLTKQDTLK